MRSAFRRGRPLACAILAVAGLTVLTVGAGAWVYTSDSRIARSSRARLMGMALLDDRGVVRQQNRADCGPAALLYVLRHRTGLPPLEELVTRTGTRDWGISAEGLARLARELGVDSHVQRVSFETFERHPRPAIALLSTHFVVLENREANGSFTVMDPGLGRVLVPQARVRDRWRGVVVVFPEL